jgi:hypothetical protein
MYADEDFEYYRCSPDQIAAIRQWAQAWANRLAMEVAQEEPWSYDEAE